MIKDFKLQIIEDVVIENDIIPGLNGLQINYNSSIGNKPDIIDPDDLGSLAYDDAVEKAKLGTSILEGGYLKTGFVDASRIDTGVLNADRIAVGDINTSLLNNDAGWTDDSAVSSLSSSLGNMAYEDLVEAAKLGTTVISGGYIRSSLLTADNIKTGSLTGRRVQTHSDNYTGVKLGTVGSDTGIFVYGQTFRLLDTSGNLYGYIGGYGGYYNIATYNNRNMLLDAGSATIHFYSHAAPLTDGGKNLGYYNYRWGNCYTLNLTFQDGYYLNKSGNVLQANGFTNFYINGHTFRPVGFTFKDGSGNNKYIVVLATNDPI